MNAKLVAALAACCLAVGGVGMGLAAWANGDNILGRYPGSTQVETRLIDLPAATHGTIVRQVVYDTTDTPEAARQWYAARLHQSWSAEVDTNRSCAWLTHEQRIGWLHRDLSVSVCNTPYGAHVVVTESMALEP